MTIQASGRFSILLRHGEHRKGASTQLSPQTTRTSVGFGKFNPPNLKGPSRTGENPPS
jgi:hypothetical protein